MLFNIEVEQLFLGCIIIKPELLDDCGYIKDYHFYQPVHGRIYNAIKSYTDKGKDFNIHQIAAHFENDDELKGAGGSNYIFGLEGLVVAPSGGISYAETIKELYTRRAIQELGKDLTELAGDFVVERNSTKLITEAESLLSAVSDKDERHGATKLIEALKMAHTALNKPFSGTPSGLYDLDRLIRGFEPECLYILAGRPAMGKTALGLTIGLNAAYKGASVLYFSLEMSEIQLTSRILSRLTGKAVHSGEKPAEIEINDGINKIGDLPVYVDDQAGLNVSDICRRARVHKRKHGLDMLIVDYLGLIQPEDSKANKVHQIETITTRLKILSKQLKIPVILFSQLSRSLEQRDNKRPILSDLRDSGAIEQDADCVIFIYRHEYYLAQEKPKEGKKKRGADSLADYMAEVEQSRGKAELIVAKNRQGETGTANVRFDGAKQCFTS